VLFVPRVAEALIQPVSGLPGLTQGEEWLVGTLRNLATGEQWHPVRLAIYARQVRFLLKSFWAAFGWGSLFLAPGWYWAAAAAALVAVFGLARRVVNRPRSRARSGPAPYQRAVVAVFGAALLLAVVPHLTHMLGTLYAITLHGRSLLPTLVPVSALLALGWQAAVPPAWQGRALTGLALALLVVQAVAVAGVIMPFFYG
jgi:hypothetical protein